MATTTRYYLDGANSTTPPLKSVMRKHSMLVATIIAALDADASAVITHNMQLSAADIASGYPNVLFTPISSFAQTSVWYVQSIDPNWIGLAKHNVAGGGDAAAQLKVSVLRPNTIIG